MTSPTNASVPASAPADKPKGQSFTDGVRATLSNLRIRQLSWRAVYTVLQAVARPLFALGAALFVYAQYLENAVFERAAAAEQVFGNAVQQLEATSQTVRNDALRTAHEMAFRSFPVTHAETWYAPGLYINSAISGRRERRFLERGRLVLADYVKSAAPLSPSLAHEHRTRSLLAAALWIQRESDETGKERNHPDLALLMGATLQGATVPGIDLAHALLLRVNLDSADLSQAKLSGAVTFGASFRYATLRAAQLDSASLVDARLQGARAEFANFRAANLERAGLDSINAAQATFLEADLRAATLRGAVLVNANLASANLSGADLRGAQFGQASIAHTDFTGARLDSADLRFVTGFATVKSWRGATFRGALLPPGVSVSMLNSEARQ